jgi:hypothetical protein
MPISFAVHPKRMVRVPAGNLLLVLIRRNIDSKVNWSRWTTLDRGGWAEERLLRLLRRDRTWRVEIYERLKEEPVDLPGEEPSRVFVAKDKNAAVILAERVASLLATGDLRAVDLEVSQDLSS